MGNTQDYTFETFTRGGVKVALAKINNMVGELNVFPSGEQLIIFSSKSVINSETSKSVLYWIDDNVEYAYSSECALSMSPETPEFREKSLCLFNELKQTFADACSSYENRSGEKLPFSFFCNKRPF